MNLAAPPPDNDESNWVAFILAALVHLLLIGALFFGVQWKSTAPTSVAVEVWSAPPPAPVARPEPRPEPPPEIKPEPKPEPKPIPKAEPTPTVKPDIAIKEEKKPKKEEPPKPEPKKEEPKKPEPKKEEPKKTEPKKEEPPSRPNFNDELNRDLKQSQQQEQRQRTADDMRARADAEAALRAQANSEQASVGKARGLADYQNKLRGKIRGNITRPEGIKGNPEAVFEVTQLPTGEVLPPVKILKSSGNKALDEAVERAILKSSPLPKPDDPSLFERVIKIPYKPFDE